MKLNRSILLMSILIILWPSQAQFASSSSLVAQNNTPEGTWTKDTKCSIPFWTALNLVVRDYPPSRRLVFVHLESQNFTTENLRKVFRCVSQQYAQPEELVIIARSNKDNLLKWTRYYQAFHSVRPDGSFVKTVVPSDVDEELLEQTQSSGFWADYLRFEITERFSFSLYPTKEIIHDVIRTSRSYSPTGDMTSDLVRASKEDLVDQVGDLLNKGANVNARNLYGNTPLAVAALAGNSLVVRLLLDKGADVNATTADGWTPLMCAILSGNSKITEELLRRGADVNARAVNGESALTIAISKGQPFIVEDLLRKGASAEVSDRYGRSPLTIAEESNHFFIVSLLKQHLNKKPQ